VYPTFGSALYGRAVVERRLGRLTDARTHAELARLHAGDLPPLEEPLFDRLARMATGVLARIELAKDLVEAGRVEEAVPVYEEILDDDPDNLNATINLLNVSDFLGRHDRLDDLYAHASKVYPNVQALHQIYGTSLARRGRLDEAAGVLRAALALDEADAETLTMLGEVVRAQGQFDEARRYFERALQARPSYRVARLDLGRELLAASDAAAALAELLRVIEEDAADPTRPAVTVAAMVLAAVALDRLGDIDAARGQLEEARQAARERQLNDLLPDIDEAWRQLEAR
jgi:tetratricopeptide (TPR) repeat protein